MKIELIRVKIKEIMDGYGYLDKDGHIDPKLGIQENGVVGYGGKLNIRPAYQREFIYKTKQRDLVVDSVMKNRPLSIMYWSKNQENEGTGAYLYELMDGQQRTMSICSYVNNEYSINDRIFDNLTKEEQDQILNYELMIYVCEGTEKEKLEWFNTINIAGEKLTDQELRNAIYTGEWLTDAKKYFSKNNCPAYLEYSDYLRGSAIRQDYLETALKWISNRDELTIEGYMSKNQKSSNASELWQYFVTVLSWVRVIFPEYRSVMKGIEWGLLYNKYKDNKYNAQDLEDKIKELMIDDDVTSKKGIYEYLLSGDEKHLNIRSFSPAMRRAAYEKQEGICAKCGEEFSLNQMEADHITPWSQGGKTNKENCQMLCKECNRRKSNK